MKPKAKYCSECDKTSFLSEASALRKVNQYEDIVRYYKCPVSDAWHITSKTFTELFQQGIIVKSDIPEIVTKEDIDRRLKELKNKL